MRYLILVARETCGFCQQMRSEGIWDDVASQAPERLNVDMVGVHNTDDPATHDLLRAMFPFQNINAVPQVWLIDETNTGPKVVGTVVGKRPAEDILKQLARFARTA